MQALRSAVRTCRLASKPRTAAAAAFPLRSRAPSVATAAAAAVAAAAGVAAGASAACGAAAAAAQAQPSVLQELESMVSRLDGVQSAVTKTNAATPGGGRRLPVDVRPGRPEDAGAILGMIHELAILEKELDQVQMTAATLRRDGWPTAAEKAAGAQPRFETFIAEVDGVAVGFALYFHIYSTWEGLRCAPPCFL